MRDIHPSTLATTLSADDVRAALQGVAYPGLTRDIVSFGMLHDVSVCGGQVRVQLALRTSDVETIAALRREISRALVAIGATLVTTEIVPPAATALPVHRAERDPWADQVRLTSVRNIVAVGAGKGGVGKSTVAVNLACALARDGARVGLLDADIYGPSLPILLGIADGAMRARMTPEKHIVPLEAHGLPVVSFGFFLGEGSPAVWRGPMVSKAVRQFARGVAWPELDLLIVDLPPGTGDVPLSLAQSVALSGAVVVTQPARVAAAEARKAVEMFRALEVPVLGIVENMTGAFGEGAGRDASVALDVPFLGAVPFDAQLVQEGDDGTPTVLRRPDGDASRAFAAVADAVAASLGWTHVHAADR